MLQPQETSQETEEEARERMEQLMRRSKIGLMEIENRLGLQGTVLAAYMLGSRVWGTATYSSDYDVIIVTKQGEPHRTLHWANVDALVYSLEEWQRQLDAHYVFGLVCTMLPAPWVLRAPPASLIRAVSLQRPVLAKSVSTEISRDWNFACKCYAKEQVERAQKTLGHALRLCLLAIQLAEQRRLQRLFSIYSDPVLALPLTAHNIEAATRTVKPVLDELCARIAG